MMYMYIHLFPFWMESLSYKVTNAQCVGGADLFLFIMNIVDTIFVEIHRPS